MQPEKNGFLSSKLSTTIVFYVPQPFYIETAAHAKLASTRRFLGLESITAAIKGAWLSALGLPQCLLSTVLSELGRKR
jgi:hypothetical protein